MSAISSSKLASFHYLLKVFLPLTLSLLSGSFLFFLDRAFVAHFSLESLEACTTAISICLFLQVPFIRIASMTNPIVGNLIGAGKNHAVGSSIWQMIWFSLLSSFLTLPIGLLAMHFVLQQTLVESLAIQYLQIILPFNFIFPLGVVLSSFFIATGRRWLILKITIASHFINVIFNYLFIFGIHNVIPPLGIRGAAIGSVVAQLFYCLALFYFFQSPQNQQLFKTRHFKLQKRQLGDLIKKWSPFGLAKLIILLYWLLITRIMLINGEIPTLILSMGVTLFGTFIFINDGFNQAIITCAAQILGAKEGHLIWKLVRSSFLLLFLLGLMFSIPCYLFKENFLLFFIREPISSENFFLLMHTSIWIWCFFLTDGFLRIFQSLLFAAGDAIFHLGCQAIGCLFIVILPIYYMIHHNHSSPDRIWLVLAVESFIYGILFSLRARKIIEFYKQPMIVSQKEVLNY